jgi:hypothetical protein
MHYAAAITPIGWLKCNGALVSRLAYPQLFAKIGYTYGGAGNDFRLPDLRGEFLRGWDDGRGIDANRTLGSWQKSSIGIIDPSFTSIAPGGYVSDNDPPNEQAKSQNVLEAGFDLIDYSLYTRTLMTNSGGSAGYRWALNSNGWSSGGHRPRNVAMMACIKAFGDIDNPELINANAVLENINNKVDKRGDIMSGRLTLSADPTSALHAATKQYVDVVASNQFTITYGNEQYSTSGFSNTATRGFDETRNYFDVYPPAGKTMSNLAGFIPSIAYINFAGDVDNNDQLRCRWLNLGDRIRVQVQNTEQSLAPAANWIAFWR